MLFRSLEWVEVADNIVDLVDVLIGKILFVRGQLTSQDTGVDGWMEGLNATTEHLWGVGDGGDIPSTQSV